MNSPGLGKSSVSTAQTCLHLMLNKLHDAVNTIPDPSVRGYIAVSLGTVCPGISDKINGRYRATRNLLILVDSEGKHS